MKENVFGNLTGIDSAGILQEVELPRLPGQEARQPFSQDSNMLWEYGEMGTIGGIAVREDDLNLPIDSVSLLDNAFELHATPRFSIFWLSPDNADGIREYEDLLKKAEKREIMISTEERQYDTAKSAFMVLVRYDEVEYRLHKRFAYLYEERQNG